MLGLVFFSALLSAQASDPVLRERRPGTLSLARSLRTAVAVKPLLAATGVVHHGEGLVKLDPAEAAGLKVVVRDTAGWKPTPTALTNTVAGTFLKVPVGVPFYVTDTNKPRPTMAGTNFVALPGELSLFTADGRRVGGTVYLVQERNLRYNAESNCYETTLMVGWSSTNKLQEVQPLLPVHVALSTSMVEFEPKQVAIDHLGVPGEHAVSLRARTCPKGETVTIRSTDSQGWTIFSSSPVPINVECLTLGKFFALIFPWPVWLALTLGSLVGAVVRHLTAQDAAKADVKPVPLRRRLLEAWLTAVGTYALMIGGYATSGALPPAALHSLVGAMGWGVLSGWLGAALFDRILAKPGQTPQPGA